MNQIIQLLIYQIKPNLNSLKKKLQVNFVTDTKYLINQ